MGATTGNFNLIKPAREDFYNIADQNNNMDIIDTQLKKLNDIEEASKVSINKLQTDTQSNSNSINSISELISSGAVQTPRLTLGANKISIPDVPVSPRIEFTGMSYVNLLGKDGDCEDVNRWDATYAVNMIDTGSKAFGKSSFKVSIQGTKGYGFIGKILPIEDGKYYMLSAYMKNGNASEVHINLGGYGGTPIVTQTSSMQRVCGKWHATSSANMSFNMVVVGTDGQYGYFDGLMLTEIPESDYALPDAELMAKYPYVESYGVLTNPYFENRRYNLVRNGNCEEGIGYWRSSDTATTSMTIENGRFKIISNVKYGFFYQVIKVKPNTVYSIFANTSGNGVLYVDNIDFNTIIANNKSTFNTGANSEILILLHGGATAGTSYFDSIMLVEGSTVPAEYKACDLQRFVVEGQFTQDDKVVIEDGKVSGELNWKHCTLYGKDYSWQYNGDISGGKILSIPLVNFQNAYSQDRIGNKLVKPDGSMANEGAVGGGVIDNFNLTTAAGGFIYNISDVESGWAETINPNNDEVKAFMNGWRAGTNNGSRYTGWVSIVDNTIPSGLVVTASYGTNASGQNKLNVVDSTKFAVNDWIYFVGDDKWVNTCQISSISGNQLTLTGNLTGGASASNPIAKQDQTQKQIDWVKNNIAPNYKGYQLHYKLANPEPVTDMNIYIQGDLWNMVKGDNYLYVDSGIVLDETVEPASDSNNFYVGIQNYGDIVYSPFKYPAQDVDLIYKNHSHDPNWVMQKSALTQLGYAYIKKGSFDKYASYTVDYQLLKTLYSRAFGSLALSYKQSIASTLESHSKELEQKQNKDSVLDTLVDLSIYEEINIPGAQFVSWYETSEYLYCGIIIPFKVSKKVIPLIRILEYDVHNDGEGSIKLKAPIFVSSVTNYGFTVEVRITDTSTKSNIKSRGAYFDKISVVADCRGRI
jgi:hypothetical protein